jgi:hypothetical protein
MFYPKDLRSINTAIASGKSDDDAVLAWLMRVLYRRAGVYI